MALGSCFMPASGGSEGRGCLLHSPPQTQHSTTDSPVSHSAVRLWVSKNCRATVPATGLSHGECAEPGSHQYTTPRKMWLCCAAACSSFRQTEHLSWKSAFFQATSPLDLPLSGTEGGQQWLVTHREQRQGRKRRCAWGPIPAALWKSVWRAEKSPSEGLVHTSTNRVPVFRD